MALASDTPPTYQRAALGSVLDVFEPRMRELLREYPTMPATVIAQRTGDLAAKMWHLLAGLGGVPKMLVGTTSPASVSTTA